MNAQATNGRIVKGIPASAGIAIGKAYVLDEQYFCVLRQLIAPEEIEDEIERFHAAVESSQQEINNIREGALEEMPGELPVMLLNTHAQILRDPTLIREIEEHIRKEKHNAEWALKTVLEEYSSRFTKIRDGYFRDRLLDIKSAVERLQRNLILSEEVDASLVEPVILVAHDLTPADTLKLDTRKVLGIATDAGGKTSHAGILAASMDIPAVVGLKTLASGVRTGDTLIVDGSSGMVVSNPSREQFLEYNTKRQKFIYADKELHEQIDLDATTLDGETVRIMANIESSNDLSHLQKHGAEGVGLFRTEYLFLRSAKQPGEEEQYQDYRKLAEFLEGKEAIIRTFDLGGDKLANFNRGQGAEQNPALGLRAIRFSLAHVSMFKTQLRAILRASAHGNIQIMYPLITTLEELQQANSILDEVKEDLRKEGIPFKDPIRVGIMIETPSSVMIARELAAHCDFFSIGTNDLIQYAMAIDRVNEWVAYLYQPLSPAILRMLQMVIRAAGEGGVDVSVCGKMAGDPVYALLLLGFGGVRELSMDPHSIPMMKKTIRSVRMEDARKMASRVVELGSTKEIHDYLRHSIKEILGKDLTSDLFEDDI
ncbi:MAG: phosphoenolpyruvate--protein phosphotransferase [Nitrospinota bacterium]|nr:phosphoenolpyruvate--protein phosphotransferase [Nitrospinota bacterium]MDH5677036.1 phosphoenolpyruvate--protein phosphotransferase [Nitrospinota bacterium]MDH5755069.1 phosphoenolpyruvate--protein phosphotransferase [Nitrospinota bacterium]